MRNRQFDILLLIAMVIVIFGHLGTVPGTFLLHRALPTYAYHMALFIFISGYFFKDLASSQELPAFMWKKTKRLLLPVLGWNVVYAGIAMLMHHYQVTDYFPIEGSYFTLQYLLTIPLSTFDQFTLNVASWFVVCLFMTQVVYACISVAKKKVPDWLVMILLIILGVFGVHYATPHCQGIWDNSLYRTLFTLPFFHLGYCYRKYEAYIDRIPSSIYFAVCILGIFLFYHYGCNMQTYSYVLLYTDFGGSCWKPFVSSLLGIMLWTRIARIVAQYTLNNKLESYAARNTLSIMIHHLFVMFLMNWIAVRYLTPCDEGLFRTTFYSTQPCYSYWTYVLMMFFVPLGIKYVQDFCVEKGKILIDKCKKLHK